MNGRLRARAMAFLILGGLMVVPGTLADCPEVPHHCQAKFMERLSFGETKVDAGTYEDDPVDSAGSKQSLAVMQANGHEPISDGDGELEAGETGGVLIVINDTGNATQFTITLDPNPTGITYLDGNTLVINAPANGSHHLIPFRVDRVTDGLGLRITVEDQNGNKDSDLLRPFGLPVPGAEENEQETEAVPAWYEQYTMGQLVAVAAVALGALLLVMFLMRRIKK